MKDIDTNLAPKCHYDAGTVSPAISDLRLRRSVAHRSGQRGCIDTKDGFYIVRFRQDVPGQAKRKQRSVRICPEHGAGKLNQCERELRAQQILVENKANDLEQIRTAAAANSAVTFREQSGLFLRHASNR